METNIFRKLGLSEGEIKVYKALLILGQSSINAINEKAGLERRYIYDVLNKLIQKGLIGYTIEKGRKTFQITDPNKLISYIEEEQYKLEETKKEVKEQLPQIIKQYQEHKPQIKVEIHRGKEGFKAIGEDMLNYKDVWFIGGGGEVQEYLPHFWKFYNKKRIKKKIMWHDLIKSGTIMGTFKKKNKKELKTKGFYEFRILPSQFRSPNIICIYGNNIANMLWEEDLFAVVIQNETIANSYLDYFKYLWNIIKR